MEGRPHNSDEIPPPPWQLGSGGFVCIGVAFDEAAARKVLPPQFRLTPGATGGFYHYDARDGWGITPYVAGFAYLDVEGYDAPDGSPGKLPFLAYFTQRGHDGFNRYLGIPNIHLGQASIERSGDLVTARSGTGGQTLIDCHLRITGRTENTPLGSGINYWVWDREGEVHGMACAFTSQFLQAEPLHAGFNVGANPALAALQPRELLWAGYMPTASFSISSPYVLGPGLRQIRPGREAAYLALLGELGLGTVVVDGDRRVVYLNAVVRGLDGDGLVVRNGAVRPESLAIGDDFAAAIAHALEGIPSPPIALPRGSGRKPLIAQAVRLGSTAGDEAPAALVLVTDPARGNHDPIRSLELLGLTPAEARIAALVGSGLSPREAGELAGNTEGTVRTTLRQIYDKLDIGRQSELARLVARLEIADTSPASP
jgi:DNA-binding CsgD family transcriptional regulator